MSFFRWLVAAIIILGFQPRVFAQCPSTENQATYAASPGQPGWFGYVYDGADNFAAADYRGRITINTENFDYSFCGDNCNLATTGSCVTNSETFSVRFRRRKTIPAGAANCGVYTFTIGGDDGVRLSIDGGATYISTTLYNDHAYATTTATAYLTPGQVIDMVLEYYENAAQNRVSFSVAGPGANDKGWGGIVAGDQNLCQNPVNPAAFTSVSPAAFCTGTGLAYRWQRSTDNVTWTDINPVGDADDPTYDPPSGLAIGTYYYRRRATRTGGATPPPNVYYSNTITVIADSPQGNPATYPAAGAGWIGYVYDGVDNFTDYRGNITEPIMFNETFCGDNCFSAVNGCDIQTETFTVRFRMQLQVVTGAAYTFTIGGDDGVRLSINGGSTYLINDYTDHGYRTAVSAATDLLPGTYQLVLDFFENGGGNQVSFSYTTGPLPVTWSFFDGYHKEDQNIIEWKTASEKINAGFEIQRSLDGVTFDSIGFVPGNGTTSLPSDYVFRDTNPVYGWNYYRLKQIDLDGASAYSRLIPVHASTRPEPLLYPNPASKEIFIAHLGGSEPIKVSLKNSATGQAQSLTQDIEQPARFLLGNVQPGIYVATFMVGKRIYHQKVVVY